MIDPAELMAEKCCPDCGHRWASHCRSCKVCHFPKRSDHRCGCKLQAPKRAKSTGANLWNGPVRRAS